MIHLLALGVVVAGSTPATARLQQTGDAEATAGRWDTAARYYEQAHRGSPDWPEPLIGLARAALQQGDLTPAGVWFERLAALETGHARVGVVLGNCVAREREQAVPGGTCRGYLEVLLGPPDTRLDALEALVVDAPALASAWADLARQRADPEARRQAIERGLAAQPGPQVFGELLVLQQQLLWGVE